MPRLFAGEDTQDWTYHEPEKGGALSPTEIYRVCWYRDVPCLLGFDEFSWYINFRACSCDPKFECMEPHEQNDPWLYNIFKIHCSAGRFSL